MNHKAILHDKVNIPAYVQEFFLMQAFKNTWFKNDGIWQVTKKWVVGNLRTKGKHRSPPRLNISNYTTTVPPPQIFI